MINENINWDIVREDFLSSTPFNNVIIDNFWSPEIAEKLYSEFPKYNDEKIWNTFYNSAIENKKTCNSWDKFPKVTYQAFTFLSGDWIQDRIRYVTNKNDLFMDIGLHGGGWHAHGNGGNLNMHLDYNIHPKLGMQRKLNIIIYLQKDWDVNWGGGLEFWTHDFENNQPKELSKVVDLKFNRAVLFDTTNNSWHGLPYPLKCPEDKPRQSMAAYYLGNAPSITDERPRALFAPREDQKDNTEIKELIKLRSSLT